MTTTNGKVVEHVHGTCERINSKGTGIKVLGEWLNVSQYHPIPMPTPGEIVDVQVERSERGAWIKTLSIVSGTAGVAATSAPAISRDSTTIRLTVLEVAANFLGLMGQAREEVRSDHVLVLAAKWLRWVEQTDEGEEEPF
jgi:hypothetical protein